ncbi:hypothetical protein Golob_021451, partial [Gossypium lobatum]|nr:hypothetical protein [Gossypium lobatum]
NCKGISENAIEREWTNFCLPSEEPTIFPIVQEFYLALKQREVTRPFYGMGSFVMKIDLKELKNVDTEEILRILMEGKEVWTIEKEQQYLKHLI